MRLLKLGIGIAFCFALCQAETIRFNFNDAPGNDSGFAGVNDRKVGDLGLAKWDFTGLTSKSWTRIGGASLIPTDGLLFDGSAGWSKDPDPSASPSGNMVGVAPEPITVAMVGGGLILLGMMRPKRRRNR